MILPSVLSLFCLFYFVSSNIITSDPSGVVSVSFKDDQWNVTTDLLDWDDDQNIIARCQILPITLKLFAFF